MLRQGRTGGRAVRRRIVTRVIVATFALTTAAAIVPGVRGAVVSCGATILSDTVLTQDVGPCSANGISVGPNVTLDLRGHRIFGTEATGDGIGIRLFNATSSTVMNGTVSGFDAGIVIVQGGSNTVTRIAAVANVGTAGTTVFGDGILIDRSPNNIVSRNVVRSNGPFSGISVIGAGSVGNKIAKNTVQNNDVASNAVANNDVGIRLEEGTEQTTLKENLISFSGLDGVAIFQGSRRNVLLGNEVKGNGFHDKGHRKGDGIRVFGAAGADENLLRSNLAQDNAANGIALAVGATGNSVRRNKATRNGFATVGAFDLADDNPGCDQNTWRRSVFKTRNQSCIK